MSMATAAPGDTATDSFPGQGIIQGWAGIADVDVSGAVQQAARMYAGNPGQIRAASVQVASAAQGMADVSARLQGTGAQVAQSWRSDAGTQFLTSHNASVQQINAAKSSADGLSKSLAATAQNVQGAKNGVATASGLTAAALSALDPKNPDMLKQAQADLQAWVSAIGSLHGRGEGVSLAGGAGGDTGAGGGGGTGTSGGGAGTGGGGALPAGVTTAPVGPLSGNIEDWMRQALAAAGIPATEENLDALRIIIQYESNGQVDAVNNTDSNAAAGNNSRGLMQVIPTTFAENHVPGTSNNINDPVANIAAGATYAIKRYGSLQNVPGVVAVHAHPQDPHAYVGY